MKILNSMKKRIALGLGCLLALSTLFTACSEGNSSSHDTAINVKKLKEHLITVNQAVDGYKRYTNERISLNRDTLKSLYGPEFNDTRMVRFDLETIKSYIAYVEKKSATKGIKPEGLQFYFSVHPNTGDQPNQQTFFIAPTVANQGVQAGYTIVKKGDSTEVIYLNDLIKGKRKMANKNKQMNTVNKAAFFNFFQEGELDGTILNMGSGTPPGE